MSAKTRILVLSGEAFPGHEKRNLPLVRELLRRGYDVRHTGPAKTLKKEKFSWTMFDADFASSPESRACRTRLFSSWAEFFQLLYWPDIIFWGTCKGPDYLRAFALAKKLGKVIIHHEDFIGDPMPAGYQSDLVAARGTWSARQVEECWGLDPKRIYLTGSLQFDVTAPQHQKLNRSQFCQKYGLDERKKIVAFLPPAPSQHTPQIKAYYRAVCRTVIGQDDFELIIKPHPREYAADKQELAYLDATIPSWQQLVPEAICCEKDDKYECYRHCDLFISLLSCSALETALFRKPLLYVEITPLSLHFIVKEAELKSKLPKVHYSVPARKRWWWESIRKDGSAVSEQIKSLSFSWQQTWQSLFPLGYPDYIGTECTLDELPGVLVSEAYRFEDSVVYDEYIEEYCFSDDGLAYKRIADIVERFPKEHPSLMRKLAIAKRNRIKHFFMAQTSKTSPVQIKTRMALGKLKRSLARVKSMAKTFFV